MEQKQLQIGQYVLKHPILDEKELYKRKYINVLEYFVRKYSYNDKYSKSMLSLYKEKLLTEPDKCTYMDRELKKMAKGVMSWKLKKFKFISYKYCLLIDVIFICSFNDIEKSKNIYYEISQIYNKRYHKKLEYLYAYITDGEETTEKWDKTEYMIECIRKNKTFLGMERKNILVTANMSAGKSTLLNALVGKKISKTQNDSCTAKTHYLLNKAFEDTLSYEDDFDLELDASLQILMDDNDNNSSDIISVGTRFRTLGEITQSVCFIDTPGVNSSQDRLHAEISYGAITEEKFDLLIYVLNGENIGTDDDRKHLRFVAENYKGKVIFVINKLDRYKKKDDSVEATLGRVHADLLDLGYQNPIICPISAYAAYLAKMHMFGEKLNEDEEDELERLYRKLNKEEYQFNRYYSEDVKEVDVSDDKNEQLLLHSGILSLEKILYDER